MKKSVVVYGSMKNPLMRKAVEVLSRILLDSLGYAPACLAYAPDADYTDYRCIHIGTKENHPLIAGLSQAIAPCTEAYAITVRDDTVFIEGFDEAGVLYGCVDFYNRYMVEFEYAHAPGWCSLNEYHRNLFDRELPDFSFSSAPSVSCRGIWTWGHVIYDFRKFVDHMVMLKLNTIIIWNDFVPINAVDLIDYAHSCGVRVIFGYSWGWDDGCHNLSLASLRGREQEIFDKYKAEYGHLPVDGIYFQSITEVNTEYLDGLCVADTVVEFVNRTAGLFFAENPELELQFGLHASSVKNRLEIIRKTDPRLRIVWEDCGAFPFSYFPHDVAEFEQTQAFVSEITALRGAEDKFGVVTKAMTKLYWPDFTHQVGPIQLGAASDRYKAEREHTVWRTWKYLQAYWMTNADKALESVRLMAKAKQGDLYITALVEDGMFEEKVMFPVALYAEMLWDCDSKANDLVARVALRDTVSFA